MGWFRNTKSKKQSSLKEELWTVCPGCKAHVFKDEWESKLKVCPNCNFHDRLTCSERLTLTIDDGSFRESNKDIGASDHLNFSDAKGSYADKAKSLREKLGLNEAVMTGSGNIGGIRVSIAIMDFRFIGGSLGSGAGEKILLAAEHALRMKRPYIVFSTSGGARMQEGIVSLMQMAKTCAGIARLKNAGLPYISVMTNPTFGGVSASYAMVGDLNIAEPKAVIGFAGRRVIEQTIKQKLPDDFQTAEYLVEHGFVDKIVARENMKPFLNKILKYWKGK
jgi:acetyl-CoA carboxylase carboxyl transferase subunit beta